MTKKYTIGLDIGTTSVGWAVIDNETFNVMRKKGQNMWGVNLFETATTAESRRLFRSSRKRYDHRRNRLKLLQAEFLPELNTKDKDFITKLNESKYCKDDDINKSIKITPEENKAIKNYNKTYPTIYHLRQKLIEDPSKEDIRLVYLAIHHIIKYRGNFLYGTGNFNINNIPIKDELKEAFAAFLNLYDSIDNIDYDELEQSLYNPSKNDKKLLIEKNLNDSLDKKVVKELVKLFVGDKFSIATLFNIETEEDLKISFKGSEFDDNLSKIDKLLNEKIEIFELFKSIYDQVYLKSLFKGSTSNSISSLMVEKYNIFKEDLKNLKTIYKKDKDLYKKMFKTTKKDNKEVLCIYDTYIKKGNYEEFTKEILKDFETINDNILDESLITIENNIQEKIKNNTFMPKITDVDNGKYPYQLNKEELIKIIENQGQYYQFLKNKCSDGTYKIVKLLEFCIPYYVGPLGNTTSNKNQQNPNYWLKKKEPNIKITPYNFNEVVDLESSAENFINRMIGNCTYLLKEKAIPANSILYSKFKVLNELKQIKVGEKAKEERLTLEMQQKIYKDLFLKTGSSITDKKFKDFLLKTNDFSMVEDLSVIGYSSNNKFANNMSSYVDFFGEDGILTNTCYTIDDAEEIIRLITIFEDKEILRKKITNEYKNLSPEAINKICHKKYKGWSNLSKKLLTELYYEDKTTKTPKSIMTLMEETNENFMQIINNKEYNFDKLIKNYNKLEENTKLSYDVVKDLATSPANKRGIYQSLKVIAEIVDFMGYEPSNISLEMARGDEAKKRIDDRKKHLEDIYNKYRKEINNYQKLKKELNEKDKINSEKLFLYFIQEGKSLYSGTTLNINELDKYEVDHIIPRTLIKDNSIENKALVLREENQIKAASYVLPSTFRNDQNKAWWQHLKKLNLMTAKKYNNLVRYKFDQKSIDGFINRQLVETRQICKHTAHIIENFYKKSKVIYLSASLSHNYREKYELFKFRELNNYHHAHDAYLAAVLGNYKINYLKDTIDFSALKELNKKLYDEKRYQELKDGYVINSLDPTLNAYFVNNESGEVFDTKKLNDTIINNLYRNDILISKKVEFRTGELFNQTIQPKGSKGVSLKKNMPTEKYGSYTSINPSYACVVKYTKKGKTLQKMVGIPIYIDTLSKKDKLAKNNYLKNLLELNEDDTIKIIRDKIPFNTLLNWKNQICYLVGASDKVEVCNAKEFNIDKTHMQKWKYALNRLYNSNNKDNTIDDVTYEKELEEIILYIIAKIEKEYVLYQNLLPEINRMFGKEKLKDISLENKEKIIIEMFKLLKADSITANMKFLNRDYSSAFGRKHGKPVDHAIIINKSVTGLRTKQNEF